MTINLHIPTQRHENLKPTITVVGVGGAGGNAVNNMIASNLEGVNFVVANTDAQALDNALTERAIQLGAHITQGLGAGANPDIGRAAAEEAQSEIMAHIEGSHMVFITAGMGGGTGTGAAPAVARMARELGVLTVAVVTKPFHFEGTHRMKLAEAGLEELQKYVDTMIVIPNQNLFRIANEKTTFADAFRMADEVLHSGVRGVTDLMIMPGLINLDFADIRTVMREMGKAMMGTGEATGERRAVEAAEAAISNPLLDDVSMKGARGVLINITGGRDMTLFEVDEAANRIRDEVDPDANIIFGSTFSDAMEGKMRVSVVATGIDQQQFQQKPEEPSASTGNAAYTRTFSNRSYGATAGVKTGPGFVRPQHPSGELVQEREAAPSLPASLQAAIEPRDSFSFPPAQPAPAPQPVREESFAPAAPRMGRHSPTRMEAAPITTHSSSHAPAAETTEMASAASRGGRVDARAQGKTLRSSGGSQQQPALWQEEEEETEASTEPNFLQRMTARFTPREEQPIRRTEVVESRPSASEREDYLEIPAFLRRQAN